jgi:hypothetical protein
MERKSTLALGITRSLSAILCSDATTVSQKLLRRVPIQILNLSTTMSFKLFLTFMNGQKVKVPATTQPRSLGRLKSTAVRHWLSSKTLIKRIERKLLRLNGKLMSQAELKKLKSQDKSSFSSKNKRQEKLLQKKSLLLSMKREKE